MSNVAESLIKAHGDQAYWEAVRLAATGAQLQDHTGAQMWADAAIELMQAGYHKKRRANSPLPQLPPSPLERKVASLMIGQLKSRLDHLSETLQAIPWTGEDWHGVAEELGSLEAFAFGIAAGMPEEVFPAAAPLLPSPS